MAVRMPNCLRMLCMAAFFVCYSHVHFMIKDFANGVGQEMVVVEQQPRYDFFVPELAPAASPTIDAIIEQVAHTNAEETTNKPVVPCPKNERKVKILIGVQVMTEESYILLSNTWARTKHSFLDTILYSTQPAFAKKRNVTHMSKEPALYQDLVKKRKEYDWFLRCPSTAYVDATRLHTFLRSISSSVLDRSPLYLGWAGQQSGHADAQTHCQIWNHKAAQILYDKCKKDKKMDQCLLDHHVGLTLLRPTRKGQMPEVCDVTKDSWLYPNALRGRDVDSLGLVLSLEHPEKFPSVSCSCTVSLPAQRMRTCGDTVFASKDKCKDPLQLCPITKEPKHRLPTSEIVAYSMSLHHEATEKRMHRYMPPTFKSHAVDGIFVKGNGLVGYRKSMYKTLKKALADPSNELIAVFDDDFRVSKEFDARWKRLTKSNTCYHDTLSQGGVVLLGTSVWSNDWFKYLNEHKKELLHDGICYDAHSRVKGSYASIFSRKAAIMAVTWLEKTDDMSRPFDWLWGDMVELGYPVRAVLDLLFAADVEHSSAVDPERKRLAAVERHKLQRWGAVDAFRPSSGTYG